MCTVGLKLGTEYQMMVVAINDHGENEVKMKSIKATTSGIRQSVHPIRRLPP